jgi:hypothetical protein
MGGQFPEGSGLLGLLRTAAENLTHRPPYTVCPSKTIMFEFFQIAPPHLELSEAWVSQ